MNEHKRVFVVLRFCTNLQPFVILGFNTFFTVYFFSFFLISVSRVYIFSVINRRQSHFSKKGNQKMRFYRQNYIQIQYYFM